MSLGGCGARSCECGVTSSSLVVTRSGDTFGIESMAFGNYTSIPRPASPVQWQHIYETDTGRYRVWDGTYWVITGGSMPGFQLERQSLLTLTTAVEATVPLPTEIYDTDGFHTGSDGFATIPAGYGGDYIVIPGGVFAASAAGQRNIRYQIAGNSVTPTQNPTQWAGGWAMLATTNNGFVVPEIHRLEAGATLTLRAYQTSGGNLDLTLGSLKGFMIRHLPALV